MLKKYWDAHQVQLAFVKAPFTRNRLFFNPLGPDTFHQEKIKQFKSSMQIRNLFHPLSRVEIFEYAINAESCGR